MIPKNYQHYTAKDFSLDEDFQQWVLRPDIKNTHFWNAWQKEHPEKQTTIDEAIKLIQSVNFHPYEMSEEDKDQLWDAIQERVLEPNTGFAYPESRNHLLSRVWKYAAAVIIGLITTFSIVQLSQHQAIEKVSFSAQTKYGEVKKIVLPDSSEVILNAHSKIVYTESEQLREVWIEGEAYFHVKPTDNNEGFLVHTYDHLNVAVLGTKFNVNTYGHHINVTLQQGSVKVEIKGKEQRETQLYMKPGERVSYDKQNGDYTKNRTNVSQLIAWTEGRLIMNNYSLKDAARFIEQVFNQKLIINDSLLLREKASGSMPVSYNIDTMLMQFEQIFNVRFSTVKNGIVVRKK